MQLEKIKAAIFLEKMFEDIEFFYPYYRMKEEGAEITVIAPEVATYNGKHGIPFKSEKSIKDVDPDDFDVLIIPGGYSPDHMRRSPEMINFVRGMNKGNKTIAAICHAPWMLASAGILKGKKVTSFFSIKDDIINAGGVWQDKEVVVDGNIITSRKPDDLPAFCRVIIDSLVNRNMEVET